MFNFSLRSKIIFIGVICLLLIGWLPTQPASAAARLRIGWDVIKEKRVIVDYFRLMKRPKSNASVSWVWVKNNIDSVTNEGMIPSNYDYIIFEETEAGEWLYTIDAVKIDETPAGIFTPNIYNPLAVGATVIKGGEDGVLIVSSTVSLSNPADGAAPNAGTPIPDKVTPPSLKEFYLGGAAKKAAGGDYFIADAGQFFTIGWDIKNAFPADKPDGPADLKIYYTTYDEAKNNNCLTGNAPKSACINKDIIKFFSSAAATLKNKVSSSFNTNFDTTGIYFISLGVNYNNTNYNFNSQSEGKGPLKIIINPPKLANFSYSRINEGGTAVVDGKKTVADEMILFKWVLDGTNKLPVQRFEIWRAPVGAENWEQVKQQDNVNMASAAANHTQLYEYNPPASDTYNYGMHIVLADGSYLTEADAGKDLIEITFNRQITPPLPKLTHLDASWNKNNTNFNIIWSVNDSDRVLVRRYEVWRAPCTRQPILGQEIPGWQAIGSQAGNVSVSNYFFADSDSPAKGGGYCYGIHIVSNDGVTTTEKDSGIAPKYVLFNTPPPPAPVKETPAADSTPPIIKDFSVNGRGGKVLKGDGTVSTTDKLVHIYWEAQDNSGGSGLDKIEILSITGVRTPDLLATINPGTATSGSYDYTIPVGSYQLAIRAVDKSNNKIESASITVNVTTAAPTPAPAKEDTTPPAILSFSVSPVFVTEGDAVKIFWQAKDNEGGSGIAKVEIYQTSAGAGCNDAVKNGCAWTLATTLTSGLENGETTISGLTVGVYYVGIHVTDRAAKPNTATESTDSKFSPVKVTVTSKDAADSSGSCGGVATVRDIKGNIYNTVAIGAQCWMKSNLRATKYPNGAAITKGGCSTRSCSWGSDSGYYSCPPDTSYNFNREDCAEAARVGMLYQWSAAMNSSAAEGAQGICPSGWHVPSDAEWETLITYLGGASVAGNKLKQTTGWSTPNIGSNSSGFTALPAGTLDSFNYYYYARFWSSGTNAYVRQLNAVNAEVSRRDYTNLKGTGLSVRCLKGAAKDEYQGAANSNNDDAVKNNAKSAVLPKISNADFNITAYGTGEYVFSIASSPYPYEKKKPLVLLKWEVNNNDPAVESIDKFVIYRALKGTAQWTKIGENAKNSLGKYSYYDRGLPDTTKKYQYRIDILMKGESDSQVLQTVPGPLDSDNDWISDADEKSSGTNPNKADSDGDGLSDWEEIHTFMFLDTAQGRIINTDPNKADTDGDGYSDYDEIINCYSPFIKTPKYNTGCVK